jgi:O-antigen ligase
VLRREQAAVTADELPLGGFSRAASALPVAWIALASSAALAVGTAATFDVPTAIVLAIAVGLMPVLAVRPPVLLAVLVASVFLNVLSVGGVAIGRLIAPIALVIVVIALVRGIAVLTPAAPVGWAVAYAIWALASGLWTVSFDGTLYQLGSLVIALTYMLAFATLLGSEREILVGTYLASAIALCIALLAIMSSQGRAEGISGDPNEFARVELVMLPVVIVLATHVRPLWQRVALAIVVAAIVIAVFASLSRGGMLTLAAITFLLLTLPARTLYSSTTQKTVVVVLLVIGAVAAFQISGEAALDRVNTIFANEDETGAGRLNAWKGAWTSIQERPVLGLGYGGFDPSANELMLRTPGVDLSNQKLLPGGLKAHSTYIGTLAELGIPGFVIFLGLFVSTIRMLRRVAGRARSMGRHFVMRFANALVISLIGWAVASLFLTSETSRSFWIIVGLSVGLMRVLDQRVAGPPSRPFRSRA